MYKRNFYSRKHTFGAICSKNCLIYDVVRGINNTKLGTLQS